MTQHLAFEPSLVQAWQQFPFQEMHGIEVLENMRAREKGKEIPLERLYKRIRQRILRHPFDKVTIIGTLGRTGSAKSSLLQGFYRVLLGDQYLRSRLNREEILLDVMPVPFSLYAEAAKSATVHAALPQFAVSSERAHGAYSRDEYARISGLMSHDITRHVLQTQGQGKAIILLLEPSSTTAVPIASTYPAEVAGIDRGLSPLYDLALNEHTRELIDIFALERDAKVEEEAVIFREHLTDDAQSGSTIFSGDIHVVYSDLHDMTEGDDAEVRYMTPQSQQRVRDFTRQSIAPPEAKRRSDAEFEAVKEQSHFLTDRELFTYIETHLNLPKGRFHYIDNPHLLGRKTFDLDYFIHSLAVRYYPEIVSQGQDTAT